MRQAVARFLVAGLLAVLVVSIAGWWVARSAAQREAVDDARQRSITLARAVVTPHLTAGVLRSDPDSLERFDRIIRGRVLDDNVRRVRLWSASGRVVYADQTELIGERLPLTEQQRTALRTGEPTARESDLTLPENRLEGGHGTALEVYLPVRAADGTEVLFETYQTSRTVLARRGDLLGLFAPITLAGLALLLLALVPMVWSLARRLQASVLEREALLSHALEASTTERRRIAAHLHDGLVQSMAGSSYALSGVAEALEGNRQPWAASVVNAAAAELRQNVRALRSLLVEIYPPSLHRAGLEAALSDLTAQLASREIEVRLDLGELPDLPAETETVLFRVAQEGVRNIVKHAAAGRVDVVVRTSADHVTLVIADDGQGSSTAVVPDRGHARSGHLGLSLLDDSVREAGGTLTVRSAPGQGTTLTAEVPRR